MRFQHLTEGGKKVRTASVLVVNLKPLRDGRRPPALDDIDDTPY